MPVVTIASLALLVGLQLPAVAPAGAPLDDVQRLAAAADNDARFDALTEMLRVRDIPFVVEPFTIDAPRGREPRTTGRNIVVTLGEGADEIVLGAHYDAARLADGTSSRGAVDNGASSVALVHVAAALRAQPLAARVRVVWFDMEELGLLGSARWVAAHRGERIRAMLNFDINGYGDTVLFGAAAGGEDPRLLQSVTRTCARERVDCVRFDRMPPSDDRSFGAAGIPTLSMATLPAAEAHQLWLQFHPDANPDRGRATVPMVLQLIHTAADTIDKVDGATLAQAHRFVLSLVRDIAGSAP